MTETEAVLRSALGEVTVRAIETISGRGVFSIVERCHLGGPDAPAPTVIVKRPTTGPNHDAARDGGAYRRETLAYTDLTELVDGLGPSCHGIVDRADGGVAFVLEDLERRGRIADQVVGLSPVEAIAVAETLARWHDRARELDLDVLDVRRDTPAQLPLAVARLGLERLDGDVRPVFEDLLADVDHHLMAFRSGPGRTLCHGDPRADNITIVEAPPHGPTDDPAPARLFDFQQLAVQTYGADLAWLLATSLEPQTRRAHQGEIVAAYADRRGLVHAEVDHALRVGAVLPGLAVLLLVQRAVEGRRAAAMVATSVERIAAFVIDAGTASLGAH